MPKGLKQTSSTIAIGFTAAETAPNTFEQTTVDLNMDPLNREVFVVLGLDLDVAEPDALAGADTATITSVTTTSQTTLANIGNSNCLARKQHAIRAAGFVDSGVGFVSAAIESPASQLEYLGIIATNDFFVQVQGQNNATAKSMAGKLYGFRAQASADIYAALVQSEVLSA
jgi:hypothetical protein